MASGKLGPESRETPLAAAAGGGYTDIVQSLLAAGAPAPDAEATAAAVAAKEHWAEHDPSLTHAFDDILLLVEGGVAACGHPLEQPEPEPEPEPGPMPPPGPPQPSDGLAAPPPPQPQQQHELELQQPQQQQQVPPAAVPSSEQVAARLRHKFQAAGKLVAWVAAPSTIFVTDLSAMGGGGSAPERHAIGVSNLGRATMAALKTEVGLSLNRSHMPCCN